MLLTQGSANPEAQDYEQAIKYDNKAIEKLGAYPAAIQDYDKAIEINPKGAESYNNRGLAKAKLGAYPAAIQDYSRQNI